MSRAIIILAIKVYFFVGLVGWFGNVGFAITALKPTTNSTGSSKHVLSATLVIIRLFARYDVRNVVVVVKLTLKVKINNGKFD